MKSSIHRFAQLAEAALLLGFLLPAAHGQITFTGLGYAPGSTTQSWARAVTADGSVVVGLVNGDTGLHAAVWKQGVASTLMLPAGGINSSATGVSDDGKVISGLVKYADGTYRGVVWNEGVVTELAMLPGAGGDSLLSWAGAVSGDGKTIVGRSTSADAPLGIAASWTNGVVEELGDFSGGYLDSSAQAVGADGSVIVGFGVNPTAVEAARWQNGVMTGLGDLPGGLTLSRANAVSADGAFIVGEAYGENGREAFLWSNNQMMGLGTLGTDSNAYGVALGGGRVVGTSFGVEGWTAFLWDPQNGMQLLEDIVLAAGLPIGGWHLSTASAISPDGSTIVGYGFNLDGKVEAWKITLDPLAQVGAVPEPSTYSALAALALLGAAAHRRLRTTRPPKTPRQTMLPSTPAQN